ncbi:MAG: threonine synthase [archaeon]
MNKIVNQAARLRCIDCKTELTIDSDNMICGRCGGLLDVVHDIESLRKLDLRGLFDKRLQDSPYDSGVWRYKELIYPVEDEYIISKNEGNTGLHRSRKVENYAGADLLLLKHEGENPTGSFKDRGMTVGMTAARKRNARAVVCASTGNTSASLAAYAAESGIKAVVVIPEGKIAYGKLAQALSYGAKTVQIRGDFDDALKAVRALSSQDYYLLNSINPFRIEGQKSIGFEAIQQLGWVCPDWFIIPGGNLGNVSALGKGLRELLDLGIIKNRPRIAVIQAEGANPFYLYWKHKRYKAVKNPETIATAIKIGNPASWKKAGREMGFFGGTVEVVSDQEIMDAKAIVDSAGIGAEPASCSTVAGARKLISSGIIRRSEKIVCILTGNLLKDPDSVISYHTNRLAGIRPAYANAPVQADNVLEAIK